MQDEVNEKIIALCVQTTRMSTGVLKASMRKFLDGMSRQKQKRVQVKQAVKTGKAQEKGREKERKRQEMKKPHGKQTIKQLIAQGAQLTNIQITDQNIKSFDRVARKYGIDYSLKKDSHMEPPLYLVFFKSKDVDVMTAAFKEYAGNEWTATTLKSKAWKDDQGTVTASISATCTISTSGSVEVEYSPANVKNTLKETNN